MVLSARLVVLSALMDKSIRVFKQHSVDLNLSLGFLVLNTFHFLLNITVYVR